MDYNLDDSDCPNILFLRGCFIDDINKIKIIEQLVPSTVYEPYRPVFKSRQEWIKQTTYPCLFCSLKILNIPKPLPIALDKNDDNYEFTILTGYFCSWECVQGLITRDYRTQIYKYTEILDKLRSLW